MAAKVIAGVIVLVLVALGVTAVYMERDNRRVDEAVRKRLGVAPGDPLTPPPDVQASRARRLALVREDRSEDDAARAALFRALIAERGRRCDRVLSALSPRNGRWVVACAPGYRYALAFDTDGALITAAVE